MRRVVLLTGDSLVAAVEWVEEGQWLHPQYLRELRPEGQAAVARAWRQG